MGRVRMLQARWDEAIELTAWAEDLFIRTTGKDKGFMAKFVPLIVIIALPTDTLKRLLRIWQH